MSINPDNVKQLLIEQIAIAKLSLELERVQLERFKVASEMGEKTLYAERFIESVNTAKMALELSPGPFLPSFKGAAKKEESKQSSSVVLISQGKASPPPGGI